MVHMAVAGINRVLLVGQLLLPAPVPPWVSALQYGTIVLYALRTANECRREARTIRRVHGTQSVDT